LTATSVFRPDIKTLYVGFVVSWFCFIFMLHEMNLPHRRVSLPVLIVLGVISPVLVIVDGFVLRRTLFRQSAEALPHDPLKASERARGANLISFCCALSPAIFGAVLRFLGTDWSLPGILFGVSLIFLLLWRPNGSS